MITALIVVLAFICICFIVLRLDRTASHKRKLPKPLAVNKEEELNARYLSGEIELHELEAALDAYHGLGENPWEKKPEQKALPPASNDYQIFGETFGVDQRWGPLVSASNYPPLSGVTMYSYGRFDPYSDKVLVEVERRYNPQTGAYETIYDLPNGKKVLDRESKEEYEKGY